MDAGMVFLGLNISDNLTSLSSGTATIPILGLIVEKSDLFVEIPDLVMALKRVVLPIFVRPIIPNFILKSLFTDYGCHNKAIISANIFLQKPKKL